MLVLDWTVWILGCYRAVVVGHRSWSGTVAGGSGVDDVGAPVMFGLEEGNHEMRHVEAEMMASGHRCFRSGEASACGWRSTERRQAPVGDGDDDVAAEKFEGGVRGVRTRERKEGVQGEASGTFVVAGIDFERR